MGFPQVGEFITACREADPQSPPDYALLRELITQIATATASTGTLPAKTRRGKKSLSLSPPPTPIEEKESEIEPPPKRKATAKSSKRDTKKATQEKDQERDPASPPKARRSNRKREDRDIPNEEDDEEEEEEEKGNTPVKNRPATAKVPSEKNPESWKERVVTKQALSGTSTTQPKSKRTKIAATIDLTEEENEVREGPFTSPRRQLRSTTQLPVSLPPPPAPSSPLPAPSTTNSLPTSVVLTITRCAAWKSYVGMKVTIPLASIERTSEKKKRKSGDQVVVSIGAEDICNFPFEKDEYMSGW
jgi:hypothetical protein